MRPIFVFSLPRSGSTMLQRLLMAHKDIRSVAEPWILLPLVYAFREQGVASEYSAYLSSLAINDFIDNLPNGKADYFSAAKHFVQDLYTRQCTGNEIYFLDKTPRYFFIIPEIAQIFPEARFIFLFRNPIHVFASILSTWGHGRLNKLNNHRIDLLQGPSLLAQGWEDLKNKSLAVSYENLVTDPRKELASIFAYLEIPPDYEVLKTFTHQKTHGRLGDPSAQNYTSIQTASIKKAEQIFTTPYRKYMVKKYIRDTDDRTLSILGYEKKSLLEEISAYRGSKKYSTCKDLMDLGTLYIIRKFYLNLICRINNTVRNNVYIS